MLTSRRLVFTALFVVAGCASESTPDDVTPSADELVQTAPIQPVDLLACWVDADPAGLRHELRCAPKVPSDYPLPIHDALIEADTADGKHLSATVEQAEALVGELTDAAFPLKLQTRIALVTNAETSHGTGLKSEVTLETARARSKSTPELYRAPFVLWPVQIRFTEGVTAYAKVVPYLVPVPPYRLGMFLPIEDRDPTEIDVTLRSSQSNPATFLLFEPASKSIGISVVGATDVIEVKVDGPGNYEYDGASLKKLDSNTPSPE